LGTVGAILGATAGFDGEKCAELDLGFVPVSFVDGPRFLNEFKKGKRVEVLEFFESHGV
jgi:hypothetical protein